MSEDWNPLKVTYNKGKNVSEDWEYQVVGTRVRVRRKGWRSNVALPILNPHDPAEAFAEAVTFVISELER